MQEITYTNPYFNLTCVIMHISNTLFPFTHTFIIEFYSQIRKHIYELLC